MIHRFIVGLVATFVCAAVHTAAATTPPSSATQHRRTALPDQQRTHAHNSNVTTYGHIPRTAQSSSEHSVTPIAVAPCTRRHSSPAAVRRCASFPPSRHSPATDARQPLRCLLQRCLRLSLDVKHKQQESLCRPGSRREP
ncbi:hypothetical protein ACI65C_005124 [Semiaphis heraclei]